MEILGMFAKHWRAGQVKTRLGATIGMQPAAEIHRLFVQTAVKRFGSLGDRRILAYAPHDAEASFAAMTGDAWRLLPQSPGSLGDRISQFFAASFAGGSSRVVLIGSDSPNLPVQYVHQMFRQLEEADVTLGPAEDGGYYAIGLKSRCDRLFEEIAWSTPDVLEQTLARCRTLGLRTFQSPTWYDVDTQDDLSRLQTDLPHAFSEIALRRLAVELTSLLSDCPPQ
ncbi:MAG: TIGR04282 family arsenosugar biosynthesis glycosyltransferase [Blastopirellula sp. JB062]